MSVSYRPRAGTRPRQRNPVVVTVVAIAGFFAVAQVSAPLAVALYAAWFLWQAWSRPEVALALIFAASPFQNDVSAGGPLRFSLSEISLALALPICVLRNGSMGRALRIGPVVWAVLAYFSVCVFSSLAHYRGGEALVSLLQMFLYLIVAVMIFGSFAGKVEEFESSLVSLLVIGAFLGASTLTTGSGYVFGLHKNGIGASLAGALMVAAELWVGRPQRRHPRLLLLAIALITGGLTFTLSRGAWMSAVVGLMCILGLRRQFRLLSRLLVMLVPLIVVFWIVLPPQAREQALNFDAGGDNVRLRRETVEACRSMFAQSPLLGVGTGLRKQIDATNLLWVTLAETGIAGLAALAFIHVSIILMVWQASRRVPRTDPRFSYLALCVALVLGRLAHGFVDHYWSRGAITAAWASVGMATFVYVTSRRRPRAAAAAAGAPSGRPR
jgi:hypothetical protein